MIWWKGQGLLMGTLVALCIVSAGKAYAIHGVTIGLGSAAVLVFLARNWIDESSSLYSIPVRFWPPLLAGLSLLTFFKR